MYVHIVYEESCFRRRYQGQGHVIYMPQYIWDVIICPRPRYLLTHLAYPHLNISCQSHFTHKHSKTCNGIIFIFRLTKAHKYFDTLCSDLNSANDKTYTYSHVIELLTTKNRKTLKEIPCITFKKIYPKYHVPNGCYFWHRSNGLNVIN